MLFDGIDGIEILLAAFEQLEPDTPLTEAFFFL